MVSNSIFSAEIAANNTKAADATLDSLEMPNCPVCGEFKTVVKNHSGLTQPYYCMVHNGGCGRFFTPVNESKAITEFEFRAEFEKRFPTLCYEFVQAMNEIGMLGRNKYGDNAVESRCKCGDYSRSPRTFRREIAEHARVHFQEYIDGIQHDVYETVGHQLAAAAFNPMVEFLLSGLHEKGAK